MLARLQRFMQGRHGLDQLNVTLLIAGMCLSLLARLFTRWLYLPADLLYLWLFFRMLSRNEAARSRENRAFLRLTAPAADWLARLGRRLSRWRAAFADRQRYKYFKCPSCGQKLRAPRGRGKIEVTCQRCRHIFQKKV